MLPYAAEAILRSRGLIRRLSLARRAQDGNRQEPYEKGKPRHRRPTRIHGRSNLQGETPDPGQLATKCPWRVLGITGEAIQLPTPGRIDRLYNKHWQIGLHNNRH